MESTPNEPRKMESNELERSNSETFKGDPRKRLCTHCIIVAKKNPKKLVKSMSLDVRNVGSGHARSNSTEEKEQLPIKEQAVGEVSKKYWYDTVLTIKVM
jgi:hypothetical protein